MRNLVISLATAATVVTVNANSVTAMTAISSAEIRSAAEAASPVEKVVCWRYGWRGWGAYAGWCGLAYAVPAYVAPPVYAAPAYDADPVYSPPRRCWIDGRWRTC
jgi:hypothetical protein